MSLALFCIGAKFELSIHDVGLSLHSKKHQCLTTCFLFFFYNNIYVPLNSENFSINLLVIWVLYHTL